MMKTGKGTTRNGRGTPKLEPPAGSGFTVTANEWDPFPYERLTTMRNRTLFATILREPLERIMSHYNFFIVENANPKDQQKG